MFQNIICNSFYYHNLTKFQSETGYYKKMDETYFYNLGINWIMKNSIYMFIYIQKCHKDIWIILIWGLFCIYMINCN